jgi:phospholipid/cholesterol/gamma-HCH transport system ATP-binding protein
VVVTHDIATARRVADLVGMLYLRNLIYFGSKQECFDSDVPAVRQFLSGDTRGPIGMSEEADQGRRDVEAVSTYGMTAEQTEELERDAGAPDDQTRTVQRAEEAPDNTVPLRRTAESSAEPVRPVPPAGTAKQRRREVLWIPDVQSEEDKEVPLGDLFGPAGNGDSRRSPAPRRGGGA